MISKEKITNASLVMVGDFMIVDSEIFEITTVEDDSANSGLFFHIDDFYENKYWFSIYESVPERVEIYRLVDYEKQIKERRQAKQMRHLFNYGLKR